MPANRIICLIDMDCFYVQCEQKLQPDKWGKPCGVAQYNQWRGGGLIAVNYEARAFGIKRGMRTDDCVKICPEFHAFTVPERNGKAELTRYRNASTEVFDCIAEYIQELHDGVGKKDLIILEKASVDEGYIDFTQFINEKSLTLPKLEDLISFNCKVKAPQEDLEQWYQSVMENFDEDIYRLVLGAYYVGDMRKRVYEKTQFRCSAGISANKTLAKLACSVNKPNAQTILPFSSVPMFFQNIKIQDVRNLGGKTGAQVCQVFSIQSMSDLAELPLSSLRGVFDDKNANWLFMIAKGIDDEPVTSRRLCKSIGCGKQFPGLQALSTMNQIQDWSKILCEELHERLESDRVANKRIAKLLTVTYITEKKGSTSRSLPLKLTNNLVYPDAMRLSTEIHRSVFQEMRPIEPLLNLSFSASKFVDSTINQGNRIENFFTKISGPPEGQKRELTNKAPKVEAEVENPRRNTHEDSFFFNKIKELYAKGKLPFLDE